MIGRAVLLSVAPEFAEKIADGTKTVELRKRFPSVPSGTWMYLYVTLPIGAVIGRVKISEIDTANPKKIWDEHKNKVGISKTRFSEYFGGRQEGHAVHLSDYEAITPITLRELRMKMTDFVVPQSYRYLSEIDQALMHGSGAVRVPSTDGKRKQIVAPALEVICLA